MTGHKARARKTRERIIEISAKLTHLKKGTTTPLIIAAVREKHPEVLRVEKDDLIDLGLTTIITSVGNLNWNSKNGNPDLFGGYHGPKMITLRHGVKKDVAILTKGEFRQIVEDITKPPPKISKGSQELIRVYDFIKDHGEDNWLATKCWTEAKSQAA